jgi:hypothetical protein
MFNQEEIKQHFTTYEAEVYRVVEGQSFISTRKLVDTDAEHEILEEILENSKPFAPQENSKGLLDFLLFTPFRYPPLKGGGRFHNRNEQSIFYASEKLQTAMSEVAFARFSFMQPSTAQFSSMDVKYTHFVTKVASKMAIFLTKEPFSSKTKDISNPSSYTHSQPLGTQMRYAGAELFTYFSARSSGDVNVGLFSPEVFVDNKPIKDKFCDWDVYITHNVVEFRRQNRDENTKQCHVFKIEDFLQNGIFPNI